MKKHYQRLAVLIVFGIVGWVPRALTRDRPHVNLRGHCRSSTRSSRCVKNIHYQRLAVRIAVRCCQS